MCVTCNVFVFLFLLGCVTCKQIPNGWKSCAGVDKNGAVDGDCLNVMCGPMAHMTKKTTANPLPTPCCVAVESHQRLDYLCLQCKAKYNPATAPSARKAAGGKRGGE